jgi:hypothetical protein
MKVRKKKMKNNLETYLKISQKFNVGTPKSKFWLNRNYSK